MRRSFHPMIATKSLTLLAILAGWTNLAASAAEDALDSGIAVSGVGVLKARPDQLRIQVKVQGRAEIADDALVKFRDSRRRLVEAAEKLKTPNLRISDQNITLASGGNGTSYMAMMNGGAAADGPGTVEVSGNLHIELVDLGGQPSEEILKTLGKVLDAIKDAGASMGPSSSEIMMAMRYGMDAQSGLKVKFLVHDFKTMREQAYQMAVEDARQRAERLAKLNGVKLGRVISVHEQHVSGDSPEAQRNSYPWYWGGDRNEASAEHDEISTDSLGEVPITVRLMVRFRIVNADSEPVAEK